MSGLPMPVERRIEQARAQRQAKIDAGLWPVAEVAVVETPVHYDRSAVEFYCMACRVDHDDASPSRISFTVQRVVLQREVWADGVARESYWFGACEGCGRLYWGRLDKGGANASG